MNIAILGWGKQGQSSYEYWDKSDNQITVCDEDKSIQVTAGAKTKLGADYLTDLNEYDMIVRSPALHPRDIVTANPESPEILSKVWSNTNEFLKIYPTKNIIGVTGTKGKGTTSSLVAKMLESSGKTVHLGGNIGIPPLDLLKNNIEPNDWVVLELANYQLIDLKTSPHIAVCLMVVPEHLDWHTDMDEYLDAKQQLFMNQTENDIAIYYAGNENSESVADGSIGKQIPYYREPGAFVKDDVVVMDGQEICKTSEIKLIGKHNWQNVCAAVTAVWSAIVSEVELPLLVNAIRKAISEFSGLEHRLEIVRDLDGVIYVDDSFGTTPETAIVAIEAFSKPKILILGGSDKGAGYDELAKTIKNNNVKHVLLIGNQANNIKQALDKVGVDAYSDGGDNMSEIVKSAHKIAENGDVVLLSTACASFDMFENYQDRGEQFTKVVLTL